MIYPGDFFGVFEVLDGLLGIGWPAEWCVSSGSRSIHVLGPKQWDSKRTLKELGLTADDLAGTDRDKLRAVAAAICQRLKGEGHSVNEWRGSVAVFPSALSVAQKDSSVAWEIAKIAWQQTAHWRLEPLLRSQIAANPRFAIKAKVGGPEPRLHGAMEIGLLRMAKTAHGEVPAFARATDEIALPLEFLRLAYPKDLYLMQPSHLLSRGSMGFFSPRVSLAEEDVRNWAELAEEIVKAARADERLGFKCKPFDQSKDGPLGVEKEALRERATFLRCCLLIERTA